MRLTACLVLAVLTAAGPALAHDHGAPHDHGVGDPDAEASAETAGADANANTPAVVVDAEATEGDDAAEEEDESIIEEAMPEQEEPEPDYAPPEGYDETRPASRTLPDTGWRRRIRDGEPSSNRFTDFKHFHFELRFGPYSPNVDDGYAMSPYATYFGSDPQFYFGLEADWLPLYIPYVGSFGPGFSWGITSASGNAFVEGSTTAAASETSLTIMPMYVVGVFRVDGPLRELDVPIVPYVKGGLGFVPWSVSGPNTELDGVATGVHFALGGALALNAFDPSAARSMQADVGIRYANIYGEWMFNDVGGDGSTNLLVGTSTVVVGISLDI